MDNENEDQSHFMTPLLTPHVSDTNTTEYQENIDNLARNCEENLNNNYSPENINYDGENESDVQDQRPTEATDDGIDPNQLQIYPVETIIDISYQPQPSHERDDICSPEQVEPSNEAFSAFVSDLDIICEIEPPNPPSLVYKKSLCIPYEQDDVSILKESLTTTTITTTLTKEYIEPKKDKNDIGHIMISYNHSTKPLCSKIAKALKNLNYNVWIDQDNISGDVFASMASAIENSFVILMAVNEKYYQSRYCRLEAEYGAERNKTSIPMLMQPGYKATGWLGIINGSKLHIDFTKCEFDKAFNSLLQEIETVRISLGGDEIDQRNVSSISQSMTTMNSCQNYYHNVQAWNADDVIDWLNREKLQIFESVLTGFTGATLYQLYKIKLDSAPDYYRTIETLLPPAIPFRLFYILTFEAALDLLFSSSNQMMRR